MADLSLDFTPASLGTPAYGDLLLVNGDIPLTSDVNPNGTAPVLQDILTRLRMFQGEYFMDNTEGVPWLQQILTKSAASVSTDAIIQNTILSTPGVVALLVYEASLNRATRAMAISFRAQTTAGVVDYSSTLTPTTVGTI